MLGDWDATANLKIVHRTKGPLKPSPPVEWDTRTFPQSDTALLEELAGFEDQGWSVHTVERRHSPLSGSLYWVLLRRENSSTTPSTTSPLRRS